MAAESKSNITDASLNKKRKQRYLPQNKPVKKGSYPLRAGVQGFFITCDGGKERQASREAINIIDSFYDDLILGKDSSNPSVLPHKPLNNKIKFSYSDSSSGDADCNEDLSEVSKKFPTDDNFVPSQKSEVSHEIQREEAKVDNNVHQKNDESCEIEAGGRPAKKQCLKTDISKSGNVFLEKMEKKSIDKLIDDEIAELGDKNKRHFFSLDSGCSGVAFVEMRKASGDASPKEIVQRLMTSVASTRKHMSRFILRLLPIEVTCYASEEDITRAIKPVIEEYFPVQVQIPVKFAVLYDARANTGAERMKIIDAVAKSVPAPHKVDLDHPDKTIVVQIVKTVCLIGVVEKYKELAKYNLRQLASTQK